jgi:hypothetical protein
MGFVRESHSNRIVDSDFPGRQNDCHDAGEAKQFSGFVAMGEAPKQIRMDRIDLLAGIAETGDLDLGLVAELQAGTGRKAEQVEALGQDIFPEPARSDSESFLAEFVQEFRVQ